MNVTIFVIVFSGIFIILMTECYFSVPYDKEFRKQLKKIKNARKNNNIYR